ncbi:hypothetical protein [Chryseobacterium sp. SC28]|uniref:hypothetical protein n=1 Tax=Chryseobacterium sp. SC28 TaxID=2268028 RepID=UPI000F64CE2E|nr:hypothetical protein [Chryseobacterium sp. SC28]RRQ46868.1 hypothetical protein DTW91_03420 [Chryseobacterium sp. SC28]
MAWLLYFISLIPLFGYLFIKYFDKAVFTLINQGQFDKITCGQYAFIVSLILFIISVLLICILKYRSRKNFEIHGAKITSAPQNINHELIGVLSAVVLPFLTVNFNTTNEIFASLFMLLIIGVITTRSTIYYKNPVLAILKLKIYQIEIEHKEFKENKTVNVISFYTLQVNDSLYLKEMGDNAYYAKKTGNG